MQEPLLVESIRLEDGVFYHLDYHSDRMNRSCQSLGINHPDYDLVSYLKKFDYPKVGLIKCRVLYDTRIKKIHFQQYMPKPVHTLQVVYTDDISYREKTVIRSELDDLYQLRGMRDDIIIVRDGYVTDSYYGNLLFLQNGTWYTPSTNLLGGVQRTHLLEQGLIKERSIHVSEIRKYEKVKIINAMKDLETGYEIDLLDVHVYR